MHISVLASIDVDMEFVMGEEMATEINEMEKETNNEIEAMRVVAKEHGGLKEEARVRVIRWVTEHYGITLGASPRKQAVDREDRSTGGSEFEDSYDGSEVRVDDEAPTWKTFAELYEASNASTHPDGMLVAAYWVQVHDGRESFGSLELNNLLKDLGHGVTGTAKVMNTLIAKKPALILQLKKAGRTQQARKTYKMTEAGKKAVEQMIANGD